MVRHGDVKVHLNEIQSTLNTRNMSRIDTLVSSTAMNLLDVLSDNNLLVQDGIVKKLEDVQNLLSDTSSGSLLDFINNRKTSKYTEKMDPRTNARRKSEIDGEIDTLNNSISNISSRKGEYEKLYEFSNNFNLTTRLSDLDINTTATRPIIGAVIPMNPFLKPTSTYRLSDNNYQLCDENGKECNKIPDTTHPGEFGIKLTIGGQKYTIGRIKFSGGNLDLTNMTISPALKDSPQEITLSVNAIFDSTTVGVDEINVVCNKKFKLKLNDGIIPLDHTARGTWFDNYNGGSDVIKSVIETKFKENKDKIEKEILEKICKKSGGIIYDALSDDQKKEFYKIFTKKAYFENIYTREHLQTPNDRYNLFKTRFIEDGKAWNKGDNIKTFSNYITFISNNVEDKVKEFFSDKLEEYMGREEAEIKSELTEFMNDIDKNKLDNNLNKKFHKIISKKTHKMDKGPRSLLHNRDTNYMRFFSGSSISLKGEKVNVHTINNSEPVKYDMDMKISGKNNISIDIKIDGVDHVISHKSGEPAALIRKIMRDQSIENGKVRAHIGFNIYKSMIKMVKEKNIDLSYRDSSGNTRKLDIDSNGNVILKSTQNLTTLDIEDSQILFDQSLFERINNFDDHKYSGELMEGFDNVGKHFNLIMNKYHKQYRKGVERRLLKIINSPNRFTLPTGIRLSPIKTMLNLRDTRKFEFSTTLSAGGKNIDIEFKKNKFTINMNGLDKPISSRDLGMLLNKRQKRMRIFDGVERDIAACVYENLISKMRENSKINRTDFGVKDNITGNMYVLDKDGDFGMIAKEDLKKIKNPVRGLFRKKKSGALSSDRLSAVTVRKLNDEEVKSLLKNPLLMGRLIRSMNRRMGLKESLKAAFDK